MREDLKMTIDSLSEEYKDALEKIIQIRKDRQKQYGDTYLTDDFLFLHYQVLNKMKRFSLQLERKSGDEKLINREVALDSAIDCANYAIFIVAKMLNEK